MEYGRAMMARDIGRERKDLEEEEAELQKEMEKQAKEQQKKGMWGSIGKTIGSIGTGALFTALGGPAGGVLAAKMIGGYAGGRLGQELGGAEASKAGLKIDSKGNFLGAERRALGRSAETAREDFDAATKGMRNQLATSSVTSPLMAYAGAVGLSGFGKEALLAGGDKMSAWDALISQPEFAPFMGAKEEGVKKAVDPWKNPVWDAAGSYTGDIS